MKIAVITSHPHTCIGGIETNNRMLYTLFKEEHIFTEYVISGNKGVEQVSDPLGWVDIDYRLVNFNVNSSNYMPIYKRKNMEYIFDNNDIVIFRTAAISPRWSKHKKAISVQHFDRDYYGPFGKGVLGSIRHWVESLLFRQTSINNPFKNSSNSVFYDEKSEMKSPGNVFYIPLGKFTSAEIDSYSKKTDPKAIMWLGRLSSSKNIKEAVRLSNVHESFRIFGMGEKVKYVKKNSNSYHGVLKPEEVIKKFKESKVYSMTSKTEGFGWTVVEALSTGTPVVLYDTFDIAKLFNRCDAVFLINKGDKKSYDEAVKNIVEMNENDYDALSKKATEFAKEHFSSEAFKKNWDFALKSVSKSSLI